MLSRGLKLFGASLAVLGASGAVSATAAGPPPPTSTNGHRVQLVAAGLATPTSFAFGGGSVFEGDAGSQASTPTPGGVFLLEHGHATRLAGSPPSVFGLAWRKDTLYVSAGSELLAWSGWNGTKFKKSKTIFKAPHPKRFTGFNGLGFGADGRLYVGVDAGTHDHTFSKKAPYLFDLLSMTPAGKHLMIVARGIRQPWQMVFPKGSSEPFVSDLGPDTAKDMNPPDFVLRVDPGQNYRFPKCDWSNPNACKHAARPFKGFPPHSDPMGLGIIGKRLYISEFGGNGKIEVVSMPLTGGKAKTLLNGFVAPVVALGTHRGWVYVGELTGEVFRVKA